MSPWNTATGLVSWTPWPRPIPPSLTAWAKGTDAFAKDAHGGQIIKLGLSDGRGAMFLPSVAKFAYGWL